MTRETIGRNTFSFATALLALFTTASFASTPQVRDFAEDMSLVASPQPLQEIVLPDKVYATVTQWTLADLRVFNADGNAVPHAFCEVADSTSSTASVDIPVYGLDNRTSNASSAATTGHNITLHTAEGTSLTIQSMGSDSPRNPLRANASYVLDTRAIEHDIDTLWLDWAVPSGASETSVSVLSSDDLSHWQTIVSNARLLRVTTNDHTLEKSTVVLPKAHYQYLRVEPAGDALVIHSAKAQYRINDQTQPLAWYSAGAPYSGDDVHELRYENSHRVAVTSLRITPHIENSSIHLAVQSRDRPDHAWQTQWTGEVFDIHYNNQDRRNDVITIAATNASEWRLLFPDNAEPPASAPSFELGYIPARLRFLAQGNGPFILAYGNARVTAPSALPCDALLSTLTITDKQHLIGTPTIGATQLLAGKDALVIKKQIPFRTLLLWGILLVGVAIIVKIALTLLNNSKRHNQE